jgi:hypothetical protein
MLAKRLPLASEMWRNVTKVLVVASEPISADRLRAALGGASDDAEIMVVAVEGLDDAGLDARGDTG